ncbi:m7GpppX diphosphatase isoform X1 [Diaphorina citri]|uniref:m7GpppX diphosphatase n=1 Tax=Diaphorina citri TaxID=121845 RepID=A0A1S3D6X3_DIACI|nr:m7GpppX diphosphatase isoform X1 [Diaphorina citri]
MMCDSDNGISLENLSKFVVKRVLSDSPDRKLIFVEGSLEGQEGAAVLILEKKAFDEKTVRALCSEDSVLVKSFVNDLYSTYECFPNTKGNGIKTTLIYPATEKHIKKFERKTVHIIQETPEIYKNITLPYILSETFSVQWVYNILEHKSEVEKIVFEDSDKDLGFILVPDLKWDGQTLESLYLQAVIHRRDIKSIRDLTTKHIPLLENIQTQGIKAIEEKYGVLQSQLRIYVHYLPSYYHLHVHFTYLQYDAPGINTERAHLLSTVIQNIQLLPDYYQKATIPYTLTEADPLYETFCDKGLLKKSTVVQQYPPTANHVSVDNN